MKISVDIVSRQGYVFFDIMCCKRFPFLQTLVSFVIGYFVQYNEYLEIWVPIDSNVRRFSQHILKVII